ncbi:MAG: hypothetical protein U5L04_03975 [Trueperaceae bacterium]|nr:hypothetical protein [Trueperaceae bacterium]
MPFGDIANQAGLIDWPETKKQMSVVGLDAAYEHAVAIELENETIRLATPPWHVALKLIAYSERRAEKDLRDLDFILRHATEVFIDRMFDELGGLLADDVLGYAEAGAYLILISRTYMVTTFKRCRRPKAKRSQSIMSRSRRTLSSADSG